MPESSCNSNQEFFGPTLDLDADVLRQALDEARVPAAPVLPEAPVSVNVRLDIGGLCHQVTARGWTGAEAAANLQAAIQALRSTCEAPPVPTRAQRLRGLLHCALVHAVADGAGHLPLARRLVKAAALVRDERAIAPTCMEGTYTVTSQDDPAVLYFVAPSAGTCTCADSQRHALDGGMCKHRLAMGFWLALAQPAA